MPQSGLCDSIPLVAMLSPEEKNRIKSALAALEKSP